MDKGKINSYTYIQNNNQTSRSMKTNLSLIGLKAQKI